jgi:HK97 family phage major capsid protein
MDIRTLGDLNQRREQLQSAHEAASFFAEFAKANGMSFQALEGFELRCPGSRNLTNLRIAVEKGISAKGAVGAMSTESTGVLLPSQMAGSLIELARPYAILPRLGAPRVPFNEAIGAETTRPTAYEVGEGLAKPVSRAAFATETLRRRTFVAMFVVSKETIRNPRMLPMLSAALSRGVTALPDATLVGDVASSVTPTPSTGNPVDDLAGALAAYVTAGGSVENAVVIMSSTNAVAARLLATSLTGGEAFRDLGRQGGSVAGLPAICSDSAGDWLLVVDASRILVADEDELVVDVAQNVTLEMSTDPATTIIAVGSPAAPVMGQQTSLWQSNSVALRAERFVNFRPLPGSAAAISGVDYLAAATGSPA